MVKNLLKTPLTAVLFASLWHFSMVFMPFSQGYAETLHNYTMPFLGYVFMIAYGLLLSVIFGITASSIMGNGFRVMLFLSIPLVVAGRAAPLLPQLRFGEPTGVMTFSDLLFNLAGSAAAILLLAVICALVMKTIQPPPPPPPTATPSKVSEKAPDKYKFKKIDLITKLVVLPLIYCVLYFVIWYFLLWRSEAARVYYSGNPDPSTFAQAIVAILLNDVMQIPVALVKGFLYTFALVPALILLKSTRAKFIIISVLIYLSIALPMLIPNPLMPDAVRIAHLMQYAAEAVAFGALASFMLHMSLYKVEPPPAPAPGKPVAKATAAAAEVEKPA